MNGAGVGGRLLPILIGLLLVLYFLSGVGKRGIPHPGEADCGSCHLAGSAVNEKNAAQLVRSQEELCASCHEDAVRVSHPSGFPVTRPLPAKFPVDWKGDLTCSSCHKVHARPGRTLRTRKVGKEFCLSCHAQAFFDRMTDGAQSLVDSGHFASRPLPGVELDAYSLKCMECHAEEASLPGLSLRLTGNVARHLDSSVNHPVGSEYRKAERYGGYRPALMVSQKLLMPNGRLACVSCHEGYSKVHGKLLLGQGSLCFECHDL